MASVLVLGCTGMVGSHILDTLRIASPTHISTIDLIARRIPKAGPPDAKVPTTEFVNNDTQTWSAYISSLTPPPSIFFSSLATTRAAAGGFQNQYKLEHDLNIELARAAKEKGTKTYVLISGSGADTNSWFSYVKMKGEIEEHVKELGFEHTVILRPGLIAGTREESRPSEAVIRKIAAGLGFVSERWLKDGWAQEAEVIARAAVKAGIMADRGEVKEKVWVIGQKDIVRLGRTEWKSL